MTTSVLTVGNSETSPRRLHIGLWVAQAVLAVLFGLAGAMKAFTPIDQLAHNMPWVAHAQLLIRFIGYSELTAMVGLILPSVTRILPQLTPWAATGLLTIMVLATGFHAVRGEFLELPVTLALGALAAFVAWGRFRQVPIAATVLLKF